MFDFRKGMLLAGTLFAASCADSPPETKRADDVQPADYVIMRDKSATTAIASDTDYAAKAGRKVASDFLSFNPMLGDQVKLFDFGVRTTGTVTSRDIRLNRNARPPAVAALIRDTIADTPNDPDIGQGETNILFPLVHGDFKCSDRGHLWLLTDALESSAAFANIDGLLSGEVDLPVPVGQPLLGCRVTVIGLGLTGDNQGQLTSAQITALADAWRRWFIAAGVAPEHITILSGL